jgi:hypothetical protein
LPQAQYSVPVAKRRALLKLPAGVETVHYFTEPESGSNDWLRLHPSSPARRRRKNEYCGGREHAACRFRHYCAQESTPIHSSAKSSARAIAQIVPPDGEV